MIEMSGSEAAARVQLKNAVRLNNAVWPTGENVDDVISHETSMMKDC